MAAKDPEQKWIAHAIAEFGHSTLIVCLPDGRVCEILRLVSVDRFQTQFQCNLREFATNTVTTEVLDMYRNVLVVSDAEFEEDD